MHLMRSGSLIIKPGVPPFNILKFINREKLATIFKYLKKAYQLLIFVLSANSCEKVVGVLFHGNQIPNRSNDGVWLQIQHTFLFPV
jgi:hypothetical protein